MKTGETVVYNLARSPEKEAFEQKYGKVISTTEATLVTGSPSKVIEGNKVIFSSGTLKKVALTQPVTVTGQPLTEIAVTQPVNVAGQPLESLSSTQPVIVTGKPLKLDAGIVTLSKLATTKPALAAMEPIELIPTVVEVAAVPAKKARNEKTEFLNLGGLTTVNEGQYILVDGKEPKMSNGTIKGTFRITFLDKKEAEKKYGAKGTNGVILLETIKDNL
jgi:hypothetical protein